MSMSGKIYLIGFMGVGKSTVGRLLSRQCGLPLLDTDEEFARLHQGMSTGEYITTYGLERFRPEEAYTLQQIAQSPVSAVISTGGGVPVYGNNLAIMRKSGIVIHISVPLEVIESRMSPTELARRPLWATRSPQEVRALYDERMAIYNGAHVVIDGNCPAEDCVRTIMERCLS